MQSMMLWNLLLLVSQVFADDRITCCMAGWKRIRGVVMCPAPCCRGFEERILDLPLLQSPTVCHELTIGELAERQREVLMQTNQQHLMNKQTVGMLNSINPPNFIDYHTNSTNVKIPPRTAGGGTPVKQDQNFKADWNMEDKEAHLLSPSANDILRLAPLHQMPKDEPMTVRRLDTAASEFVNFLRQNNQFFMHLITEGMSADEIVKTFDKFIVSNLMNRNSKRRLS